MKQIPDFSDYFIDENGDVWSKSYHFSQNKNCELKKLKPILNKDGYLSFNFRKNGKQYTNIKLHRLIAQTFIPNPENHPIVRHLDDNKLNNTLENLMWGTQKQNMYDRKKNGNGNDGEKNGRVKLTEQQVLEIKEKYIPWKYSTRKLAQEYGVDSSVIHKIIIKKIWNHI